MRTWQLAVVGLVLLATTGCRTDPKIVMLERDNRLKEDEIYRLQAIIEDLQDTDNACGSRPVGSRRADSADEPPPYSPDHGSGSSRRQGSQPPTVELPSQPVEKVPDALKRPAGSMPSGIPEVPEHLRGPSKATESSLNGPSLEQEGLSMQPRHAVRQAGLHASVVPFIPSGDSRQAASIAINRTLTGGVDSDDHSGDQGLLVVVQPRDARRQAIDAPADISIVAIDPSVQGEAARVARWDFTAAEVASLFRRNGDSREIHLTTVWSADPPKHNKLHLFVRYITADGRKLEADLPIKISLASEKTARWAPAAMSRRLSRSTELEPTPESQPVSESRPVPESWRPNEKPATHASNPPPQTATRSNEPKSRWPAWSPERR